MGNKEQIIQALGWRVAPPNKSGWEYREPSPYGLGITYKVLCELHDFPLEEVPCRLSLVDWPDCSLLGFDYVILPYLKKRLELGI